MAWKKAFATHMEPQQLAAGPWLGDTFPGVALPSKLALGRWVMLRYGDKWTCAQVRDVGPWCIDDQQYVFGQDKPRAETYQGRPCPLTLGGHGHATLPDGRVAGRSNGAGIDLFPATAKQLGIEKDKNVTVEWQFVEL